MIDFLFSFFVQAHRKLMVHRHKCSLYDLFVEHKALHLVILNPFLKRYNHKLLSLVKHLSYRDDRMEQLTDKY